MNGPNSNLSVPPVMPSHGSLSNIMFAGHNPLARLHMDISQHQRATLLERFISNVDPLVKIFHVPTLRRFIQSDVSPGNNTFKRKQKDAVLATILFAAVTSMTDEDCQNQLKLTRAQALPRHKAAVEAALVEADFLGHHDFTTLQALVLFLVCYLLYGFSILLTNL